MPAAWLQMAAGSSPCYGEVRSNHFNSPRKQLSIARALASVVVHGTRGQVYRLPLQSKQERSAVEGVILHPVKAAADEQEFRAVEKLELSMNLVLVHRAVQDEMGRVWTGEREIGFPTLV
jgi:hypothetical protein